MSLLLDKLAEKASAVPDQGTATQINTSHLEPTTVVVEAQPEPDKHTRPLPIVLRNLERLTLRDFVAALEAWELDHPRYEAVCPLCAGEFVWQVEEREEREDDVVIALHAWCSGGCAAPALQAAVAQRLDDDKPRRLLAQMSLTELAATTPAPSWLIENVLPAESFSLLIGREFSGKTWLILSQAIAIAAGVPWLGRPTTVQGVVLLVMLDGARSDHLRRLQALALGMGVDFDKLDGKLLMYPHRLALDDDSSVAQLHEYIDAAKPSVVFVDNLAAARSKAGGGAANDDSLIGAVAQVLTSICRGGTAVVLIHHLNRDGSSKGSKTVPEAADLELTLTRASAKPNSTIRVTSRARMPMESEFALRFVDRGDAVVPEVVIAAERRKTAATDEPESDPAETRMLEILAATKPTSEDLYSAMGISRKVTLRVRKRLEAAGAIERAGGVWRIIDRPKSGPDR